jgi:hypothetical protein
MCQFRQSGAAAACTVHNAAPPETMHSSLPTRCFSHGRGQWQVTHESMGQASGRHNAAPDHTWSPSPGRSRCCGRRLIHCTCLTHVGLQSACEGMSNAQCQSVVSHQLALLSQQGTATPCRRHEQPCMDVQMFTSCIQRTRRCRCRRIRSPYRCSRRPFLTCCRCLPAGVHDFHSITHGSHTDK